jgi:hypothetical protein
MAGHACGPTAPATAVEHCVSARLTAGSEHHLILARGMALEVYVLREQLKTAGGAVRGALDGVAWASLALLTRVELNGVVASMRTYRPPGGVADRLLLACADAKLSVLEFDEVTCSLVTLCVRSFECLSREAGCVETGQAPLLRIDPGGRCAAMLVYGDQLVIIPLSARDGLCKISISQDEDGAGDVAAASLQLAPPAEFVPLAQVKGATFGDELGGALVGLEEGTGKAADAATDDDNASTAALAESGSRISMHELGLSHVRDLAFLEGCDGGHFGLRSAAQLTYAYGSLHL